MRNINLARLVSSVVCAAACSFAALVFVGCDLGTYSERVQSNGGKLPVTPVSQDSGSDSKANGSDSKDDGSASKNKGSEAKDAGSGTKDAGSGKKKVTSMSDIQKETDEKRRRESEAEGRARAAGGEQR